MYVRTYTRCIRCLIFSTSDRKKLEMTLVVFINYCPLIARYLCVFSLHLKFNVSIKFYTNLTQSDHTYDRALSIFCRLYAFPTGHTPPLKPFKSLEISRFSLAFRDADLNASSKSISIRSISFTIDRYIISQSTCAR